MRLVGGGDANFTRVVVCNRRVTACNFSLGYSESDGWRGLQRIFPLCNPVTAFFSYSRYLLSPLSLFYFFSLFS